MMRPAPERKTAALYKPVFERYYAAALQTDLPALDDLRKLPARCRYLAEMARQTVETYAPVFDIRLLVFPEFAHQAPVYPDAKNLYGKLAVELTEDILRPYLTLCSDLGIYLQTGTFLEKDPKWAGHVFNTTVLIGPDGVLSRYRKVNPWLPWEVHSSPADIEGYDEPLFPVADTAIGRLGVAVCYDWLFPQCIQAIASQQAEVICRVSAYMDPWGCAEPLNWWPLINRTRALENMVYVVAANQGASRSHFPPFSWPGGSMVVDFDGRILAQTGPGPGERIVVAPVDLAALRYERSRREGHAMARHHRPNCYNTAP